MKNRVLNIIVIVAALVAGIGLGYLVHNPGEVAVMQGNTLYCIDTVYSSVTDTVIFTHSELRIIHDTIAVTDTIATNSEWLPPGIRPDTLTAPFRIKSGLFLCPEFSLSSQGISKRDTVSVTFFFPAMRHEMIVSHGLDSVISKIVTVESVNESWYNSPWFTFPVCLLSAWLGYELNRGSKK